MKTCNQCALRGYSRELCVLHSRHCRGHGHGEDEVRPRSDLTRQAAGVAGGLALGATCALLVSTAASFVGGAEVFRALLPTLVVAVGVIGGTLGLLRARGRRSPIGPAPSPARDRQRAHRHPSRRFP